MKVVFLEHIAHAGKPGEIKEVSDAYARNFLIPKGLVKRLTPEMEKNLKNKTQKKESQRRELLGDSHQIASKLNGATLKFHLPTNGGKVFGSIGEKDVITEIQKQFHVTLTKKYIDFPHGHIKKLWNDFIYVKLGKDAIAKVLISVT